MSDVATSSSRHPWHHLHFNAPDPAAAARWYAAAFGWRAVDVGDGVWATVFEGGAFLWSPSPAADHADWSSDHGSVGTVLDHYGWSLDGLDGHTARLAAAGCEVVGEPRTIGPGPTGETLRISFLVDPFGAKLELLDDPDLRGFHHVHVLSPTVEADRATWLAALGGRSETFRGFLPGIRHDAFWILFRETGTRLAPTRGRAIDHLAFRVADADDALRELGDRAFEAEGPAAAAASRRVGFARSPGGVRVELVQE